MSSWSLVKPLERRDMVAVNAIINRPAVSKINFDAVSNERPRLFEDTRLDCEIMSIKRWVKPPVRLRKRNEKDPYNRLLFCREVDTGKGFYLKTKTEVESRHLFLYKEVHFIGQYVTIYEFQLVKESIHGVSVLTPTQPLIPITQSFAGMRITGRPTTLTDDVRLITFLDQCNDLQLTGCNIKSCCPSQLCDGSHTAGDQVLCPSVTSSSRLTRYTLNVYVSSVHLDIAGEMSSSSLGGLFFESDSFNDKVDNLEVRRVVREGVDHYQNAGVPFIIAGTFKGHRREKDEAAEVHTVRIVSIRPREVLEDFVKYRLPAAGGAVGGAQVGVINLGQGAQQVL